MTNQSAAPDPAPTVDSAVSPVERRDRNIAFVSTVLLLIGMPIGWLPGSTSDVVGLIVIGLAVLAIMAGLILWLVPRERLVPQRASRTALILGIASIIVGLVFWTGLPFAVGSAAVALGLSQRESTPDGEGRGMATAGVVLGAFAIAATFVLLLIG